MASRQYFSLQFAYANDRNLHANPPLQLHLHAILKAARHIHFYMRANLNAVVPQDFLYCFIRQMGLLFSSLRCPKKHISSFPSSPLPEAFLPYGWKDVRFRPESAASATMDNRPFFQHFHIMICL